jgi:CRISPR-associated protein Cmr1
VTFPSAEEAHKLAVDALRRFRQGVGVGRNEGQQRNRPGRSRWPEADEIRRLQRKHPPEHAPVHPVRAFPRGAFGMPIVFHFMGAGEPADAQLVPGEKVGRMTSPLILRPVELGGRWHAMAVRLVVPEVDLAGVLVQGRGGKPLPVRVGVDAADASRIAPLAAQGANPDVLAAFLAFFATQKP